MPYRAPRFLSLALLWISLASSPSAAGAGEFDGVDFAQSASEIERYDFVEVTATLPRPVEGNPFTDVDVRGEFGLEGEASLAVDGFCDSADGRIFRVRFLATRAGRYSYRMALRRGPERTEHTGAFHAIERGRRGLLRLDPRRPTHFIWEGTGEHYFWNGTTAYYLLGWDEETIRASVDRLAGFGVNRIRVLLYGRNHPRPWGQPVVPTDRFRLHLNPWRAERPDDVENPGFDLTRFDVAHWQKYERLLRHARERDIIVSVIFFIGAQVLPTPFAADSREEDLYYRYAVARLAAFSNVTWDLGNEYNFHRQAPDWADRMGAKVKAWDPYDHLASAHNVAHRTPRSTWCDMQLIQRWDAGQHAFLLREREEQAKTGRIVPQVIEEYGYEDLWESTPGQRSAETRRRAAWEIAMAGCYQTAGESARTGTGVPPDTGGGWVNGRGDDSLVLFRLYRPMVEFFTSFDWWMLEPRTDLVEERLPCLAQAGTRYVVYLPAGGCATLELKDKCRARWFDPRKGGYIEAGVALPGVWTSPIAPSEEDWVLLLERDDSAVDRTPPGIVRVSGVGLDAVLVQFSEAIDAPTACDPKSYALDRGARVLAAEIADPRNRSVRLATTPLEEGARYELTIRGVRDRAEPPNAIEAARATFVPRSPDRPLVALSFDEGSGRETANAGATAESCARAKLTPGGPRWSKNVPPSGGTASLDFGDRPAEFAVDLGPEAPELLRGLRSFTLTGWVNCRSLEAGPGGNRILHMADTTGTRAGFDLVVERDGELVLGVNAYPDGSPARSSRGIIPADPRTRPENWRFFAVTYDSTAASGHAKFYVGSATEEARLDRVVAYPQGPVGPNTGPLTVGAFNPTTRPEKGDRVFRGLIDEIRVFGSSADGSGALGIETIRAIQRGR